MLGPRISIDTGIEEAGKRVDGGPKEHKNMGAFAAERLVLVEGQHVGRNHI